MHVNRERRYCDLGLRGGGSGQGGAGLDEISKMHCWDDTSLESRYIILLWLRATGSRYVVYLLD